MKTTVSLDPENLRESRRRKNLKQCEVEKMLLMKSGQLTQYERGVREAPIEYVEKLSELYGCEPHHLIRPLESLSLQTLFRRLLQLGIVQQPLKLKN